MRFKGNALYYSIIIILLSSSTVGLILLSKFYQSRTLANTLLKDSLEQNVSSAISLIKGGEDLFHGNEHVKIDLFNDSASQVELTTKKWGAYSILTVVASQKNLSVTKKALVGANLLYEEPVALFLPDEGRIISISGSTFLRGVTYLPQKVVRPASIEGQPFIYKDLTQGVIKPSPKYLPAVDSEIFRFADHYLKDGFNDDDSIVDINSLDSMIVKNSFMNKTLIVRCKEPADLSGVTFSGNIVIWSTQPINLTESTCLTDVILFAPSIIINDRFSGSFQVYALQHILVGSNCNLAFPTILNVIQSEGKYNPSDSLKIIIGRNTRVNGGIFIKSSGLTSFLKISPKSRIFGQVYIPGNIELLGEVTGSVYCKSFYLQTSRARYENHLLNCRIDRVSLSPYFAGLDLFRNNPYKSIIEWLN